MGGYGELTGHANQAEKLLTGLSIVALCIALAYIARLQRELSTAHMRGDMYRDIAAQLDLQRGQQPPTAD